MPLLSIATSAVDGSVYALTPGLRPASTSVSVPVPDDASPLDAARSEMETEMGTGGGANP